MISRHVPKSISSCLISFLLPSFLLLLAGGCDWGGGSGGVTRDHDVERVDLRPQQTPFKDQGSRGTCITFAAVAALEAAYKELRGGDLDLSEQFLNHTGKMMWLHPNWDAGGPDQLVDKGADYRESQVAAFSGGGGAAYIRQMADMLSIPQEREMPYIATEYDLTSFCSTCNDWTDSYWLSQKNANGFNINTAYLPRDALTASYYYGVESYHDTDPNDPAAIEEALRAGHEVVWDFQIRGDISGRIWEPDDTPSRGDHSMLIVGYDRTDEENPFFIVKNSWGSGSTGDDGWTRVSYAYLRAYGYNAAYIIEVKTPGPWPELAFVGKWNLSFDGYHGELHIYHIPGMMDVHFPDYPAVSGIADRRIGTFYDEDNKAFRVNGIIFGSKITFYIDATQPNTRWDVLSGRRFEYSLFDGDDRFYSPWDINYAMAGFHYDAEGSKWGGYGRRGPLLDSTYTTPRPIEPSSYLGTWRIVFDGVIGTLEFEALDDSVEGVIPGELAGLRGTFHQYRADRDNSARLLVSLHDPAQVFPIIDGFYAMEGRILSHEPGIMAGDSDASGFYAVHTGPYNSPPHVTIVLPDYGLQPVPFHQSENIVLVATSLDDESVNQTLAEDQVAWYLDDALEPFASGHEAILQGGLPLGIHSIRFEGNDGEKSASDTIEIEVIEDLPNTPPEVTITSPQHGSAFPALQQDEISWYAEVQLTGEANDAQDGPLSGDALIWKDSYTDGNGVTQTTVLGQGEQLNARLHGFECNSSHNVTLEATDSGGIMRSYAIEINVYIVC